MNVVERLDQLCLEAERVEAWVRMRPAAGGWSVALAPEAFRRPPAGKVLVSIYPGGGWEEVVLHSEAMVDFYGVPDWDLWLAFLPRQHTLLAWVPEAVLGFARAAVEAEVTGLVFLVDLQDRRTLADLMRRG